MSQIKVRVMIKDREECGMSTKGTAGLRASWAEQMLLDKLAKYGRQIFFGFDDHRYTYEVVAETAKAFKLLITGIFKEVHGDTYDCDDWEVWMPKSACVVCPAVAAPAVAAPIEEEEDEEEEEEEETADNGNHTVYRVSTDYFEHGSGSDQTWTADDIIDAYWREDHDPCELAVFDNYDDAKAFANKEYKTLQPVSIVSGQLWPLAVGEVLLLDEEIVDGDGKFVETINGETFAKGNDKK